jgi:hypothetical protein
MKLERCPPGAEPGVRIHSGAPDISFKSTLWRRMSLRRAIREILAEASRKQLAESHRPIWPATFFGAGWGAQFPKSYGKRPLHAAVATEKSPIAGVTLSDYADTVTAAVEAAASFGGGVILVGHSMGGLPITAVGEAIPEKLVISRPLCRPTGRPSSVIRTVPRPKERKHASSLRPIPGRSVRYAAIPLR